MKDTRFYSLTFYIECLPVINIAKEIDVLVSPIGNNIGYLMPESSYKEWRLRKDDSEVYLSALIKSIVDWPRRFYRKNEFLRTDWIFSPLVRVKGIAFP